MGVDLDMVGDMDTNGLEAGDFVAAVPDGRSAGASSAANTASRLPIIFPQVQRHAGADHAILQQRHALYCQARKGEAADALFAERTAAQRKQWPEERCSMLKHDWDGARELLAQWQAVNTQGWKAQRRVMLEDSMRHFENHLHQMHYRRYSDMGWPIGSGVTEAACKTLVKQRLCRAGMRWTESGAQVILSLRALLLSETRWHQFWRKIEQFGVPMIVSH